MKEKEYIKAGADFPLPDWKERLASFQYEDLNDVMMGFERTGRGNKLFPGLKDLKIIPGKIAVVNPLYKPRRAAPSARQSAPSVDDVPPIPEVPQPVAQQQH